MKNEKPEDILTGLKDLYGLSDPFYDCFSMLSPYLQDPIKQLWLWSDQFEQARIVQIKIMNARLNSFVLEVLKCTSVDSPVSTVYIYKSFYALRLAEKHDANNLQECLKKVEVLKSTPNLSDMQKKLVEHFNKSRVVNELTALSFIGTALSTGLYDMKKIWEIWFDCSTSYYPVEA